jgi:hypothetical protein
MDARRIAAGFATVAVAVLLGACAQQPGESGGSPSPAPPTVSPPVTPTPPMPTPIPPETPMPPQPSPVPPPGSLQTITGEVAEGVEMGCVLLQTDKGLFLLLGEGVDELRFGRTATVRGYADPSVMTTCQQGTPFMVAEVVSR